MSYGESLPDQVDRVANLSDAQADIVSDIRELYRERVALERDYAAKLLALVQKTVDKKNKKMARAVVGDEPFKQWNEETLLQSTLENAYSKLIASLVNNQQEHLNLADALSVQVVGVLVSLARKNDGHRKKQGQFYQKVQADKDRIYNDRSKYDEECAEVETYRQKQERAQDDKHSGRAAKQYQQQVVDMNTAKNMYIISTAVANNVKDRHYTEVLSTVENSNYITNVAAVLHLAQTLHLSHYDALKNQVSVVDTAISLVDPKKDQELFIEHNLRPFDSPTDWTFEPCSRYYDTAELSVEGGAKIFLQNKLSRSRGKVLVLKPLLESKRKEAEQALSFVNAGSGNPSSGSVDAIDGLLDAQHQVTLYEVSHSILETEIRIIETALGGDEGSQRPHLFKGSSFTIPTECGYCATSIWGLSKQGKTCKTCGLSVHSKCELKVAADCSGARGVWQKVRLTSDHIGSRISPLTCSQASSSVAPTASFFTQPSLLATPEAEFPVGRVIYDFTPTSPFELAVHEGASVRVIEEDDGSGWVKVVDEDGGRGLVPASYIESADVTQAVSPGIGPFLGSGQFVRGLYDYHSQGPDELDVSEGNRIELTSGSSGGQNYGEGWWEGIDGLGRKGIFPSNYVRNKLV
ncbi:hypothetical protein DFH94DRAFT_795809 [Russula ochroleuca]|uniref:Uncharacterized protein n=1 Tax=Russula ochroleuca TaxID=152965 RepID=A0A9P5MPK3_9AGAM|nr:hypothetical protein DFH94DRAFT_795809 [Russula ochroleuca]